MKKTIASWQAFPTSPQRSRFRRALVALRARIRLPPPSPLYAGHAGYLRIEEDQFIAFGNLRSWRDFFGRCFSDGAASSSRSLRGISASGEATSERFQLDSSPFFSRCAAFFPHAQNIAPATQATLLGSITSFSAVREGILFAGRFVSWRCLSKSWCLTLSIS